MLGPSPLELISGPGPAATQGIGSGRSKKVQFSLQHFSQVSVHVNYIEFMDRRSKRLGRSLISMSIEVQAENRTNPFPMHLPALHVINYLGNKALSADTVTSSVR